MALYTLTSRDEFNRLNRLPTPDQTNVYNTLGRDAGAQAAQGSNDNFFVKRGKSIENALGTTGAAIASKVYDDSENLKTEQMLADNKERMNVIAKKYGYNTYHDVWDARDKAEAEGDTATLDLINNTINPELQAQANENAKKADEKAAAYNDYRENNYVSKKINQDRGKFLGSAMNTLSTGADVLTMAAGVPTGAFLNAGQGAWEGLADELEQNGFENFDASRAGQNALIGATTGAVTGALNKGISNKLAAKGGNLFKGGNAATKMLNQFNETNPWGKALSTIGSGAARGAQSGLVGGAVGAGLSSALNNTELTQGIQNALQGAGQGFVQGGLTGGAMAGANMAANAALNKISPNAAAAVRENQMRNAAYGDKITDQFKGAWNSGDSAVAENVLKPVVAKASDTIGEATGKIGTFAQNVSFQNAIKNPSKMKGPVYLGELTEDDVSGVVEAYKNAGIDLSTDPEALSAITVKNGKMYLNQDNAQHIHNARIDGNNMTPHQVRKVFRNSTGENAVVSDELTKSGNATIGAPNDNGYDVSHLYVDEDGTIGVRTVYPAKSGTIPKQLKRASGGSQSPSTNISGDEGLPAGASALRDSDTIIPQSEQIVKVDPWDRVANESGYASYNDAIESFKMANPGVEVGPNDAGKVLTWMDNNPGDWNPNAPRTTSKNAGNSPETEVYRKLTAQDGNDLSAVFEPDAKNKMENKNKLQLIGTQFENAGDNIKRRGLYGSLDASTATRAIETNAPQVLSEMGIEPESYLEFAKTSNYVNQVVTDLAEKSGVTTNIPDLPERLMAAADDVSFMGTDSPKKFENVVKSIVADGSTPDEYTAGYLLKKSREIGNKAAKIKDNSPDSKARRAALTNVKYILRDEAANALADANITGPETNSQLAQGLAKMGANDKTVEHYTKPVDGAAPTVTDYIRRSSYAEQARDMGTQMQAEKYTRSASKEPTRVSTKILRASGIEEPLEVMLNNTVAPVAGMATKAAGKVIKGAGNALAKVGNGSTGTANTSLANTPNASYNAGTSTQLYNAIGRTEGLTNGEKARAEEYIEEAALAPDANSSYAEPLGVSTTTPASTVVYNTLSGATGQTIPQFSSIEEEKKVYFFPPTGDNFTDMLSRAIRRAQNAQDYDAMATLYEMYQDQFANLQKQASSSQSSTQQKLTATQQRANAAMNSLDRLKNMEPDIAYNLSSIPVIGNIATFGGNDYEAEAKSLAQQIGYMVSGSNIKDSEAENIGKAYVPQPWDNETVRQNKLRRAYEIIQRYQNGYAEA